MIYDNSRLQKCLGSTFNTEKVKKKKLSGKNVISVNDQ